MDSDTSGGVAFTESFTGGDMYSPQQAADIAGVSRTTIMSAVKAGKLLSKKNNRGHHRIDPEELNRWIAGRGSRRTAVTYTATDTDTQVLEVRLAAAVKEAESLREQLDRERAEKERLFSLLEETQRGRGLWERLFRG